MKYTENALTTLAALTYAQITENWLNKNVPNPVSADEMVRLINGNSRRKELMPVSLAEFECVKTSILNKMEAMGEALDGVTARGDADFPFCRGKVEAADRPVALFYKGNLALLAEGERNVSVIGVLNPDEGVSTSEQIITREIISHGANIVSGLALGCDSISHRVALESGAKTIAILPSPLNDILPARNKGLAEEIVASGGLLVTEYLDSAKDFRAVAGRYIRRDRLQALFADAILLAASYAADSAVRWNLYGQKLDCGARHAMEKARLYGITRAVIYSDAKHSSQPVYDLNRDILSEDTRVVRIDSANMKEAVASMFLHHKPVQTAFF